MSYLRSHIAAINPYSFHKVEFVYKQGCKISPILFTLYVNDLAEKIKSLHCGIDIDDFHLSILLYADDVVLIAPSEQALQTMLNALNDWCLDWRLSLNREKTKIIHFRPISVESSQFNFSCGNINISLTHCYKYLGLWFQEHLDMKFATSELAKSASRALSALYTKYLYLGRMTYNTFKKLYESLVEPCTMSRII